MAHSSHGSQFIWLIDSATRDRRDDKDATEVDIRRSHTPSTVSVACACSVWCIRNIVQQHQMVTSSVLSGRVQVETVGRRQGEGSSEGPASRRLGTTNHRESQLLLAHIGSHWLSLALIGSHWLTLAHIGSHWPSLAHIGSH